MKFATVFLLFAISFVKTGALKSSGCSVPITQLGDVIQPLFLQPGTSNHWPLTSSGNIELSTGDLLEVFCSSTYKNPSGTSGSQTATCVSGVDFKIGKSTYNISEVGCSSWPEYESRKTGEPCNGGEMYENGFPVGSRFVRQMSACFNEEEEVTRYVIHNLTPDIDFSQVDSSRPGFTKGGLFGRKNVDKLYTQKSQTNAISKVIGLKNAEKFIDLKNVLYLARGHLAAKSDFLYLPEQRATFLFSNVAPQWQSFNAGNWKTVEDNVRKWVAKNNLDVTCYTGTYGVTTLPNEKGVETEIYLDYDKNNNGLMPVPMLYFRVIIQPSTKSGVVLIGVNNPHLSMAQIKKDYILCKDVSDQLDFLNWKRDDLNKGYSYACEVNDFAKKNPNLPKFDVKSLLK